MGSPQFTVICAGLLYKVLFNCTSSTSSFHGGVVICGVHVKNASTVFMEDTQTGC